MNPLAATLIATLAVVASVQGGSVSLRRAASPAGSGSRNTDISMAAVSLAGGAGSADAVHASTINVAGNPANPGQLYASTGSDVGLYQDASNYQSSQINADGSSVAAQSNTAANSGYAYDYLGVSGQGDSIDVSSTGASEVQGVGVVEQADTLHHTATGPGWPAPPKA